MDEAGAVERGEPRAGVEHDLAQLEESHQPRRGVLPKVCPDQVLEHEEGNRVGDPAIDDARDVRVVEAGERGGVLDVRREIRTVAEVAQ